MGRIPPEPQPRGGTSERALLASHGELRLGGSVAARCVQDAYTSGTTRYTEVACLAQARSGRTVIWPPRRRPAWQQERATLMRAIDAVGAQ